MIKSASRSSITNDQKYRSMLSGTVPSNEYLISTTVLTQNEPSVTFNNLNQFVGVYKHLQIVYAARSSVPQTGIFSRINSGNSYSSHYLLGTGSSVIAGGFTSQPRAQVGLIVGSDATANYYGPGIIDLLDPFSTTKNKTTRGLSSSNLAVILMSSLSLSTDAVNTWELTPDSGNFMAGSRFSLYGVTA